MNTNKKTATITGIMICSLGAIFYLYEYLLRIEPSVMVADLMKQFNVSATGFGLVTAIYYYIYTPMQVAVGILLDKYGARLVLGTAVLFCAIGSFLFSIADGIFLAGASRFLIGFGSSFAFVGAMKLAADWLPKNWFASFSGLTMTLAMLGGMLGINGLNSLVQLVGFQNMQHMGTITGIALAIIVFIFVKRKKHHEDETKKLSTSFTQTFHALGKMIKSRQMWLCGLVGTALYLSLSAFAELWGIQFLENVYQLTAQKATFACSMVFIGWLIGSPIVGWVSDYTGNRKAPLITGGFFATITIALVILKVPFINYSVLCALLLLFGTFSSAEIICFAISKEKNPHHVVATAIAFTNLIIMLGGIIFQPLLGFLLDYFWAGATLNGIRVYTAFEYQKVFMIIPACFFIGTLLAFKLDKNAVK